MTTIAARYFLDGPPAPVQAQRDFSRLPADRGAAGAINEFSAALALAFFYANHNETIPADNSGSRDARLGAGFCRAMLMPLLMGKPLSIGDALEVARECRGRLKRRGVVARYRNAKWVFELKVFRKKKKRLMWPVRRQRRRWWRREAGPPLSLAWP
jgi:hypothetical protein